MHFKNSEKSKGTSVGNNLKRTGLMAIVALGMLLFNACHDPKPGPENQAVDGCAEGAYVLNQGLFQMNNSSLSYYDYKTGAFTDDLFLEHNSRGLGDSGNDLQKYGSKMYCVVNNSNRVEILRLSDAVSLKTIDLAGKQPRRVAFARGKAYVSCFDGDIVRIDTATMEVDGTVHSGDNPEGLCVCNNKLYVANSGGLNYPNYGKTVSVIDLNSFTLLHTITVTENPYFVQAYNDRYVYLISCGNYKEVPYTFQKIDAATDKVVRVFDEPVSNFTIYDHYAYRYYCPLDGSAPKIDVLDLNTDAVCNANFVKDGTAIQTPYGITVNPLNGDVYILDVYNYSVNGDLYCFGKDGKKKFSHATGINPCALVLK